jgi:acylphosphatase
MIRRRVTVSGRVQGVFFRETLRRRAESSRVNGWVQNNGDGRVEGEPKAVERLVDWCREGPRGARVEWVDVASEDPEGLEGFAAR